MVLDDIETRNIKYNNHFNFNNIYKETYTCIYIYIYIYIYIVCR